MSRSKKRLQSFVAGVAGVVLTAGLIVTCLGSFLFEDLKKDLPSIEGLVGYRPAQTTRIYAKNGQLIGTLYRQNRTWVPLIAMSPYLKQAVIAVEDSRFYQHNGVDPVGIARAAWANLAGGDMRQGASTITMQLARNLFLTQERTLRRKAREALLAMAIERKLSKERILELYLNEVYFGSGAYGVAAASQLYFGKNPSQLTLIEAAMLAGLPQAPEALNPHSSLKKARQRQREVLDRMLAVGVLRPRDFALAVRRCREMKVRHGANRMMLKYPYFTTFVIAQLSNRYDDRTLYEGGLNVYTTLDLKSQRQAERVVRSIIGEYGARYNAGSAALVTVENHTGYIQAMVGGTGWSQKNQFNRAWQAYRQAGSAFKIFVFATALEYGYTPNTIVADKPFARNGWRPQNGDGAFMGNMPLWRALMLSRNIVAVRLVASLSPQSVLRIARSLGMAGKARPHLSLALGAVEVTPLEMAGAVAALPNDGVYMEPIAILLVTNSQGEVLEDHRYPRGQLALSPTTARLLTHMLENVVQSGTGRAARLQDRPVAGKTGTTDQCRDAWFVGYTPEWTTSVWVGNDRQQTSMWGCYGGTLPASIWHDFMASALPPARVRKFPTVTGKPAGRVRICMDSWHLAGPGCRKVSSAILDPYSLPRLCRRHDPIDVLPKRQVLDGVATYSNIETR